MRALLLVMGVACGDEALPPSDPDAGSADASEDGGVIDGGTWHPQCEDWCSTQLDCQLSSAYAWLERSVDGLVQCAYPDPTRLRSGCLDTCNFKVDYGGVDPSPCLGCLTDNLGTCDPHEAERICRSICEGGDPFRHALTDRMQEELACWLTETEIAMPPRCEEGLRAPNFNFSDAPSFSGTGRVLDPALSLALADGSTLTLSAVDVDYPPLAVGSTLAVELDVHCPFYCEHTLVLRTLQGTLLFSAWSGARLPPVLPELALTYEVAECSSIRQLCGHWIAEDLLVARPSDPAALRVPAGGVLDLPTYRIVNGLSGYRFQVRCSDTPSFWAKGFQRRI